MGKKSELTDAVRSVVHDVKSRLGAITIAVTTVMDADPGPELRERLLRTADNEARRISNELSGITSLVICMSDRSKPQDVDVTKALKAAALEAHKRGVKIEVKGGRNLMTMGRQPSIEAALLALLLAVAGPAGEVSASASSRGDQVLLSMRSPDGQPFTGSGSLVRHLLRQIDGTRLEGSDLAFKLVRIEQ